MIKTYNLKKIILSLVVVLSLILLFKVDVLAEEITDTEITDTEITDEVFNCEDNSNAEECIKIEEADTSYADTYEDFDINDNSLVDEIKEESTESDYLSEDITEDELFLSQGAEFTLNGIYLVENNNDHIFAGAVVDNPSNSDLEYRWIACKDGEDDWFEISPWVVNFEYIDWVPETSGNYTIIAQVRLMGQEDDQKAYLGVEFHKYIKDICQMLYEGEGGGFLIGFESKENPKQTYQYEMLILDCTLLAQGYPAWVYTTGKGYVAEGNAFWTVWQPEYGYYWTLFRLFDENNNLIDEVCYGFENVIKDEKPDPDLPDIYYGWIKCNDKYYFYDRTTGVLQKGGTACGVTLNDDGSAVLDQYAIEKIPLMLSAKQIVDSITSPSDSLATKQEKCYQWVAKFPYLLKGYPFGNYVNSYACPDAHYANNIFNSYGNQDRQGAECVGEAAALAYLYAELNFGDVYLYSSNVHGWVYAGGRYWDPLFVESRGRQYYNAASYEAAPTYIYKIN